MLFNLIFPLFEITILCVVFDNRRTNKSPFEPPFEPPFIVDKVPVVPLAGNKLWYEFVIVIELDTIVVGE